MWEIRRRLHTEIWSNHLISNTNHIEGLRQWAHQHHHRIYNFVKLIIFYQQIPWLFLRHKFIFPTKSSIHCVGALWHHKLAQECQLMHTQWTLSNIYRKKRIMSSTEGERQQRCHIIWFRSQLETTADTNKIEHIYNPPQSTCLSCPIISRDFCCCSATSTTESFVRKTCNLIKKSF